MHVDDGGPGPTTAVSDESLIEAAGRGDHEAYGELVRRRLLAAVASVPERARLVITCRYLLELSEAETAEVLGWPVGTVKSRLSRALDRLRAELDGPERSSGTRR